MPGDLGRPRLGLADADVDRLKGRIGSFFHVAAIYDMGASAESQQVANVEGTRHAVQAARRWKRVPSPRQLDRGGRHVRRRLQRRHVRGSRQARASLLQDQARLRGRGAQGVPGALAHLPSGVGGGPSQTGEIDKIDGPYYAFKVLQKLRRLLPPWFPLVGLDSGRFNVVPVDYVVDAMDHLAHLPGQDGECFHLTNPEHHSSGELMNVFADARMRRASRCGWTQRCCRSCRPG